VKGSINFLSIENYRGPDRGFEVTLTDLIALAMATCLVLRFRNRIQWLPYNSGWLITFFLSAIISTLFALEPIFASFTLFKMLRLFLIYWAVTNWLHSGANPEYFRKGLLLIATVMPFFAFKQKYLDGLYRIHGTFDHSNTIPLFVNLIIPLLLLWTVAERNRTWPQILLSLSAILGMLFSVVATSSRAGIAVAISGLFGAIGVGNLRLKTTKIRIITLVILTIAIAGGLKASDSIINRFLNAPEASATARKEFNQAAKMMARDSSFGVGLNNFSQALTQISRYRDHLVVMKNEEYGGVVHHIYWLTAAEMGFVGLALFLIVIGRFLWGSLKWARANQSIYGTLLYAIALGYLTLHLSGFLEWAFRITPVSYLFVIVSALASWLIDQAKKSPVFRNKPFYLSLKSFYLSLKGNLP
jgi:O-antigen ligase